MVEVQVRKPDVDVKQYRFVVLENSLQALLISDPKLDVTKGVSLGTNCNAVRLTARTLQDSPDSPNLPVSPSY
jgi:hypothetical protein